MWKAACVFITCDDLFVLVVLSMCSTVSTAEAVCVLPLFKHGSVGFFVYSVIKLLNLFLSIVLFSPILVLLTAGTAV